MFELTDYPDFRDGDVYAVAMAGGDGEDAMMPIRDHVEKDRCRAASDAFSGDEVEEILEKELERWVDLLFVVRDGDEIAEWSFAAGWH